MSGLLSKQQEFTLRQFLGQVFGMDHHLSFGRHEPDVRVRMWADERRGATFVPTEDVVALLRRLALAPAPEEDILHSYSHLLNFGPRVPVEEARTWLLHQVEVIEDELAHPSTDLPPLPRDDDPPTVPWHSETEALLSTLLEWTVDPNAMAEEARRVPVEQRVRQWVVERVLGDDRPELAVEVLRQMAASPLPDRAVHEWVHGWISDERPRRGEVRRWLRQLADSVEDETARVLRNLAEHPECYDDDLDAPYDDEDEGSTGDGGGPRG